jgi:beta-phosphoglucomutase-like phosphatase (HAD superfamily)
VNRLVSIAVVFDCDGTLIDSELLHAKALQAALLAAGIEYDFEELSHRGSGFDSGSFLRQIEEERGVELPVEVETPFRHDTAHQADNGGSRGQASVR